MQSLWQDVRYSARVLRLSPGFTLVAIVSLALGIGANTAIFQLLDAVRLRSLPVERPQELAEIRIVGGNQGMGLNEGLYTQLTIPMWQEIRANQQAFSGVFSWAEEDRRVGEGTGQHHVAGMRVSGDFFHVLGVQPYRGRLLEPADEAVACPSSRAVVSYSYWLNQMGAREIGPDTKLMANGELLEIVGVTPPQFFGLAVGERFDLAFPTCKAKEYRRDDFEIAVMGRLKPGWTLDRASAHLNTISAGIMEATAITGYSSSQIAAYKRFRLAAYPAAAGVSVLRSSYDTSLWLLLGITGLVLLIACANLANLMLARASTRQREIAVRLALGASRNRLIRQALCESGLLAVTGSLLGVGLAQILSRLLVLALSTQSGSVALDLSTDWRVLLFAAAIALLTCAVFGLLPAIRATNEQPATAMKTGGRGMTAGRERFSMQRMMVATQIAVSMTLLVGALLFVRSFRNLTTLDTGMRRSSITLAFMDLSKLHLPHDQLNPYIQNLVKDVNGAPGILNAATTTNVPLMQGSWTHVIHILSAEGTSKFAWVSPTYFQTMGIPIQAGRGFSERDTGASQRVAVVNHAFIRRFLGGANPIGKTLRTVAEPDYPSTEYEIVGVIPDTRYGDLRSDTPPITLAPALQFPAARPWATMMVYSDLPTSTVSSTLKRRFAEKQPGVQVEFVDFGARVQDGLVRERLMAMLSGFFGLLAALLATVGLYGVISYLVASRRNEIGIRVALGADRGQVVGLIMSQAGGMLVAGILAGTALSLIAGRGASSLLFNLKPYDPLTLVSAAALLAFIAALASFIPARRAAKLDPIKALRYE